MSALASSVVVRDLLLLVASTMAGRDKITLPIIDFPESEIDKKSQYPQM